MPSDFLFSASDDDEIQFVGSWSSSKPQPASGASKATLTGLVMTVATGAGPDDCASKTFTLSRTRKIHIGRIAAVSVPKYKGRPDYATFSCPVLSRNHAKIDFEGDGKAYITDQNSHHGTSIMRGDKPVYIHLQPDAPYLLYDGDHITFGKTVYKSGRAHDPVTVCIKLLTAPAPIDASPKPSTGPNSYGLAHHFSDDDSDSSGSDIDSEASYSGSQSGAFTPPHGNQLGNARLMGGFFDDPEPFTFSPMNMPGLFDMGAQAHMPELVDAFQLDDGHHEDLPTIDGVDHSMEHARVAPSGRIGLDAGLDHTPSMHLTPCAHGRRTPSPITPVEPLRPVPRPAPNVGPLVLPPMHVVDEDVMVRVRERLGVMMRAEALTDKIDAVQEETRKLETDVRREVEEIAKAVHARGGDVAELKAQIEGITADVRVMRAAMLRLVEEEVEAIRQAREAAEHVCVKRKRDDDEGEGEQPLSLAKRARIAAPALAVGALVTLAGLAYL